jgi:DNA polymerase III epsilon subunit-like protein
MHTHILQRIADEEVGYQYYTLSDMSERFRMFLRHHGFDTHYGINVAGKNFAMFDRQFLLANPHWSIKFTHRVLDPAILFWKPGDDKLPDMRTCLDRAGFTDRVTHNAVDDAILVVKLLRKGLNIPQITVV